MFGAAFLLETFDDSIFYIVLFYFILFYFERVQVGEGTGRERENLKQTLCSA